MEYKGYIIPKGNVVGASSYFVNLDPDVFPDPEKFHPERWYDSRVPLRSLILGATPPSGNKRPSK